MRKFLQGVVILLSLLEWTSGAAFCSDGRPNDPHNPRVCQESKKARSLKDLFGDLNKYNNTPEEEKSADFWINKARQHISQRSMNLNMNKAKNIIMFLGDGMSLNTLTAARFLKGQRRGLNGEEEQLSFEKFPYSALSKTYCANAQVADSACTATSYLCGVKTRFMQIGLNANVSHNNCSAAMDPLNQVSSIADWAQKAGKSTGIITTTTLTHASPSGAYAHVANRMWECDTDITAYEEDPTYCVDIATQLITREPGQNFNVMLGGGMGKFLPLNVTDAHGSAGERSDGKDLLGVWKGLHPNGVLVTNRSQLLELNKDLPDHVLGLFSSGVMNFHHNADAAKEPTLSEMTELALRVLGKNPNGYFVFIEGGLIDYGNHYNAPGLSLDETLEFEKAVQLARDMTDPQDTLIVVTADHAHPLTLAGYPGRGSNILDLNPHDTDVNGVKYTSLSYAVGLEQYLDEEGKRVDLTGHFTGDPAVIFPSYINGYIGTHAGDDVGVFASGPCENLFSGSIEQSYIPHLMAYAACIGDGPKRCFSLEGLT